MEQFTVPCAWSSNRKGSVSERLTRLQTALCDILYKRLRNTLNYLLTYLHVDVAMLLQQQIEWHLVDTVRRAMKTVVHHTRTHNLYVIWSQCKWRSARSYLHESDVKRAAALMDWSRSRSHFFKPWQCNIAVDANRVNWERVPTNSGSSRSWCWRRVGTLHECLVCIELKTIGTCRSSAQLIRYEGLHQTYTGTRLHVLIVSK